MTQVAVSAFADAQLFVGLSTLTSLGTQTDESSNVSGSLKPFGFSIFNTN